MPEDLRAHIRYPQDLFTIQAHVYATYHMQDPQVFFNKEDLLSIPRRTVDGPRERNGALLHDHAPAGGRERRIHLTAAVHAEQTRQHALLAGGAQRWQELRQADRAGISQGKTGLRPQTDRRADRSRHHHFPTTDACGTSAARRSSAAACLPSRSKNRLLYVQPLYLAAEQGSLPELKRVIVAFGNHIAMEETLETALQRIFGAKSAPETPPAASTAAPAPCVKGDQTLARQAFDHFQRSQELLKQGNWAGYGDELKKVEGLLNEMQKSR